MHCLYVDINIYYKENISTDSRTAKALKFENTSAGFIGIAH